MLSSSCCSSEIPNSSLAVPLTPEHNAAVAGSMCVASGDSDGKKSTCSVGDLGLIPGFDPWVAKIPWRREWLLTPVFFPGECHGQRSLVGYIQRVRHD